MTLARKTFMLTGIANAAAGVATWMNDLSDHDAIFALPLAEFVAARNALAARLKKAGRADEAERVKRLTKPTATAWAVNQLYWRHRGEFDDLVHVNEKVRDAQTGRAGDLRSLLEERRRRISALANVAAELLRREGHAASTDARRRVVRTLESLIGRDRATIELQAGRLTEDLEPLGFDSLAELLQGGLPVKANLLDFQRGAKEKQLASERQKAEAERVARARAEAIQRAESAVVAARRESSRAAAAAADAVARRETIERQKQEIEEKLAVAAEQERAAAGEVEGAARALADAERALARARDEG